VLADDEPPAVPASLIYPGQGRLPMKTRAFIDYAVGRLRDRLQGLGTALPTRAGSTGATAAVAMPEAPDRRRRQGEKR